MINVLINDVLKGSYLAHALRVLQESLGVLLLPL